MLLKESLPCSGSCPFLREMVLGVLAITVVTGLIWSNKPQFKTTCSGLTKENAASMVEKRKESYNLYRLTGDVIIMKVPENLVYDVMLSMVKEGNPKGGGVAYEIINKTEFDVLKGCGRLIINLLLIQALFLVIIRPIINAIRDIKATVKRKMLPGSEKRQRLEVEEKDSEFIEMDSEQQKEYLERMTNEQKADFISRMSPAERASYLANLPVVDKAKYYAEKDLKKAINIYRVWVSETETEEKE